MSADLAPLNDDFFAPAERELIITLTTRLTGSSPGTQPKVESALVNIRRRMRATGTLSLSDYLSKLEHSTEELAHFISAVTIHTTSWFRERPHYDRLRQLAEGIAHEFTDGRRRERFKILSAGCSTGEEAYSMALCLEDVRLRHPLFDYVIEGWDVDPVSVRKANLAIYSLVAKTEIPGEFQRNILVGSGKTRGLFTLDKAIRNRCTFRRQSLLSITDQQFQGKAQTFDLIFCRNVLIYFAADVVQGIVKSLIGLLPPGGHLFLGHSEGVSGEAFDVTSLGNTIYKKNALPDKKISATRISPTPTAESGTAKTSSFPPQKLSRPNIILVGASTGGTEALIQLLQDMPHPTPPVVVVQHISQSFAQQFAARLAARSGLTLGSAEQGTILKEHHLYMALGDYHIGIKRRGKDYALEIGHDGLIHGVRPSVDYLFKRAAQSANFGTIAAVLLTGMGKDGAAGLMDLRLRHAMTFVQDESSSTVFGMPKEAIMLGAAGFIGNPTLIRLQLVQALATKN